MKLDEIEPGIKEWLKNYTRGVNFGAPVHVKEIRRRGDKTYYLIHCAGSTQWSGRGTTGYYRSQWWWADKDGGNWSHGNKLAEREGRVNGAIIDEMFNEIFAP